MTREQAYTLLVRRSNEILEEQLTQSEIVLRDLGASDAEVEAALGPHGFSRKALEASRDEQIETEVAWLTGGGHVQH